MTIQTHNIQILTTLTAIKGKATQAAHADNSVKELYTEAFVSAFIHCLEHNDHTIVNTCFDLVPPKSLYRAKILKWVEEHTPLKYSKAKKTLVRKVNDGVKSQWTEQGVQAAIDNPFFVSVESQPVEFDYFKEVTRLEKSISTLIEKANEAGVDTHTLNAVKIALTSNI